MPVHDLAIAFEKAQRRDELLDVVVPRRNAGKVGVALQVVHAVRVEVRSADQLAQRRVRTRGIAQDEPQHVPAVDVERFEAGPHVGKREHFLRSQLVPDVEHRFARVAERSVADVVE